MKSEVLPHVVENLKLAEMAYHYYWVLEIEGILYPSQQRATRILLPDLKRAIERVDDVLENGFPVTQNGVGNFRLVRELKNVSPEIARAVVKHFLTISSPDSQAAFSLDWVTDLTRKQQPVTLSDLVSSTRTSSDRILFFARLRQDPELRERLMQHLPYIDTVILNFPEGLPKGTLTGTPWEPSMLFPEGQVPLETDPEEAFLLRFLYGI